MLSILIPTYNYNSVPLVTELHKQCNDSGITYEILVFDDDSSEEFKIVNRAINNLSNCTYKELELNIGRSAIRNMLAKSAKFDNLIFLDCDVLPKSNDFISTYLNNLDKDIIYGSVTNTLEKPQKPKRLRWLYTKKREQKSECSSNFYIKKVIILQNTFDESIDKYGYEDVLFFSSIKKNGFIISSLNNPVIHLDNESASIFINKVETSLKTLKELIDKGNLNETNSKIYYYYKIIDSCGLKGLLKLFFKTLNPLMIKNFNSSSPSLFLFDIYRLGYFSIINTK
ncbi:MAG: glycosyltransferase [Winogradskyella sp.]